MPLPKDPVKNVADRRKRQIKKSLPTMTYSEFCKVWRHEHPIAETRIGSEECRKKISEGNKGKHTGPRSEETRRKISESHKGVPRSEEFCRKQSQQRSGENAPNWKGGITTLNHLIRNCVKMNEWRAAVFARDGYVCWMTGKRGDIEAHHIIPYSKIVEQYNIKTLEEAQGCDALWDINNGITLSKVAHKWYHEMLGRNID